MYNNKFTHINCTYYDSVILYLHIFTGNKCDLEENRQVELSEADAMCEYFPELLSVLETSAKENKNIEEAFVTIASELKVNCSFVFEYSVLFVLFYFRNVMTKVLTLKMNLIQ